VEAPGWRMRACAPVVMPVRCCLAMQVHVLLLPLLCPHQQQGTGPAIAVPTPAAGHRPRHCCAHTSSRAQAPPLLCAHQQQGTHRPSLPHLLIHLHEPARLQGGAGCSHGRRSRCSGANRQHSLQLCTLHPFVCGVLGCLQQHGVVVAMVPPPGAAQPGAWSSAGLLERLTEGWREG